MVVGLGFDGGDRPTGEEEEMKRIERGGVKN